MACILSSDGGRGNFRWNGQAAEPNDAEALKLIDQRFSGILNVIKADTSAKSMGTKAILGDFVQKGVDGQSMWDPYKQGPIDANYCY